MPPATRAGRVIPGQQLQAKAMSTTDNQSENPGLSPRGSASTRRRRYALPAHSTSILFLIVALVLLYGIIYPNAHVFLAALEHDGSWSPANFFAVLSQRTIVESAMTSITVSVLTVLLCALAGVPLAFLFERYAFPGRRVFAALAALPLVLPPLVGTVAFIFLCGESGILARSVQHIFHLSKAPWSLRGWGALLLFHTYTMYPFFYVLTGAGLQRVDAGLAEGDDRIGGRANDRLAVVE